MKTIIILPAYNESKVIGEVIDSVKKFYKKIVVVDDGSCDNTGQIASKKGAKVLRHRLNLGVGAAINTGIRYSILNDFDIIGIMDSDGQHFAEDLNRVVNEVSSGHVELCIGSRFMGNSNMPKIKILGNKILTLVTNFMSGGEITDSQSGMRAFKKDIFQKLNSDADFYTICSEMIINAEKQGLKVKEIPIRVRYTEHSTSKGTGVLTGVKILKDLIFRNFLEK